MSFPHSEVLKYRKYIKCELHHTVNRERSRMVNQWISRSTARIRPKTVPRTLTSKNWEYLQCLISTIFRTDSITSWFTHLASLMRTISNLFNQECLFRRTQRTPRSGAL